MRKAPWIAGAALGVTLAVAAYAQAAPDGPHGPPRTRTELKALIDEQFKMADTNGDGYVTKAEFDAARAAMKAKFEARRKERRDKMFAMLDTNHDGMLSKAEFDAPRPDRDGKDGPDRGPGGPGGPDGGKWRAGRGGMMGGHGGMGMMMGPRGDQWFERADVNHDGKISLAEAEAGPLAMFDKIDTNHDGVISPEEREAARAAMRAKWRDRRSGDMPPPGAPQN
jgi:Ca2+-binding EF-hand superfamily protein